jgi:hypothetical protein
LPSTSVGCRLFAKRHAFVAAVALAACGVTKTGPPPQGRPAPPPARPVLVDPIPIDIAALGWLVQSSAPGSPEHDVASRRLRALLAVSRPARDKPPEERAEYGRALSRSNHETARRGALFALARAYQRSGELRRAAQVYFALVCPGSYAYPVPVDKDGADTLLVKPQDHPESFWSAWENRHPLPLDRLQRAPKKTPATPTPEAEELRYRTIFGSGCTDPKSAGLHASDAELLAQSWFAIGILYGFGYELEAGPYRIHRSLEALERARQWAELAGAKELAVIAELWMSYGEYERGREQAAMQASVRVLDALEGLPSRGLRAALAPWAARIAANSLTFVDFQGPPPDAPQIHRPDTLDQEPNPNVAEDKMKLGIDRVEDPALFPRARPWLPAVYISLSDEYTMLTQFRNAIAAGEAFLQRFPRHPDAPLVKERQAEASFKLSMYQRDQSPDKLEHWDRADAAFSDVATGFGPGSGWARANAGNPAALTRAAEAAQRAKKRLAESQTARAAYRTRYP